jgi:hypothetical protein
MPSSGTFCSDGRCKKDFCIIEREEKEQARLEAVVDPHIAADSPTQFLQALQKRRVTALPIRVVRGQVRKYTNPPHAVRLLRARRERPSDGRTADECNGLAPVQSITSSASASNLSGISRPPR